MIALDEDALICDFAEVYHIYNYRSLPVEYAATLAKGLKYDSRIMMRISGLKIDLNTLFLAHIVDNTAINVYFKTKDAERNKNRPKSFVEILSGADKGEKAKGFDSGEDFLEAWGKLNE